MIHDKKKHSSIHVRVEGGNCSVNKKKKVLIVALLIWIL